MGHEWKAVVHSRTRGGNCPVCAQKKFWRGVNDLKTLFPEEVKLWAFDLNSPKTPDQVYAAQKKKYFYRCENSHVWSTVLRRGKDNSCPACRPFGRWHRITVGVNDLKTVEPELVEEWNYSVNRRKPESYSCRSAESVSWKCKKGHEWDAVIVNRITHKLGCPFCAGQKLIQGENDLQTCNPKLSSLWHPDRNGDLTPAKVTKASASKVWWQCKIDKTHEWEETVNIQRKRWGCKFCRPWGASQIETELFDKLRETGISVSRPTLSIQWEHAGRKRKVIKPDMVLNQTLIVEYDGWFYHKDSAEQDLVKTIALLDAGYSLIRVRNLEFLESFSSVLKDKNYYECDYRKDRAIENSLIEFITQISSTMKKSN